MTLEAPAFLQNAEYNADAFRSFLHALLTEGCVEPGDLLVKQRAAGVNMSVDVTAGMVAVTADVVANQGKYLCRNTATVNRTVQPAPSAGNQRLDRVVARVRDSQLDGGANDDWLIEVRPGTPSGSPVAPSTPASAHSLAVIGPILDTTTTITNALITDTRGVARAASTIHDYGSMTGLAVPADSVYSDWGTPVTILNPQRTVTVHALLTGQVVSDTGGIAFVNCRVGISVDGGSTFSFTGAELGASPANSLDARAILSQHLVTARTTDDIVVKAHVKAASGGSAATASLGRLHVTVDPA